MTTNDVYEKWKQQRASLEPPTQFEANVISAINDSNAGPDDRPLASRAGYTGSLGRPIWTAVAVVAASIVGIVRVAAVLVIAIS